MGSSQRLLRHATKNLLSGVDKIRRWIDCSSFSCVYRKVILLNLHVHANLHGLLRQCIAASKQLYIMASHRRPNVARRATYRVHTASLRLSVTTRNYPPEV